MIFYYFLHYSIIHLFRNGTWELQAEKVCYKAKGKEFGVIRLKREGLLKGIKLEHISGDLSCSLVKYKALGFDPRTSQILVLTNYAYPSFFVRGQQLRVWYTEDLKGYSTSNNYGTHSIKVYVQF